MNKQQQAGDAGQQAQAAMALTEQQDNNPVRKFCRNKVAAAGLAVVLLILLLAVLAPLLTEHPPNKLNLTDSYLPPGTDGHLFGTDELGRDLFSRILFGARVSLLAALGGTLLGCMFGGALGMVAGYYGRWADAVIMRCMDGMLSFPFILLAIFLLTIFGPGLGNVILAIGISEIPRFARVVRGQIAIVKNEEYCQVERVLGASDCRILLRHILPNAISPIIVYTTLNISSAILAESALGFLGLGVMPPTPSWGNILREGGATLNSSPHIALISGSFIMLTVLAFNLFGDGVRDVLDPKLNK